MPADALCSASLRHHCESSPDLHSHQHMYPRHTAKYVIWWNMVEYGLVSLPVAMPQYLLQVWKRFPFAKNEYHKWKILGSKRSVTYRMEPESCSSFCYKLLSNMTCGLHQYRVSSTTKGQARKGMSQGRVHRIAVVHWCNIDTYSKSMNLSVWH